MSRGELVLSPKLFERRRSVRRAERRRRRRIAWAALVLVLAAGSAYSISRSRFFGLTSIEVAGVTALDEQAVVAASGLRIGSSAVGADLDAAAARIRALDGVRDARIERVGALGLMIVVEERRPALEVRWSGETSYLDRDAVTVDATPASNRSLPVLSLYGTRAPRTPRPVVAEGTVRGLLRLWRLLPGSMRSGVEAFEQMRDGGIAFRAGVTEVVFGELADIDAKLDAWRLVRERVRRDGSVLVTIDLRVPDRPAVRIV